jgi:peroxiredoxin Q/BCP
MKWWFRALQSTRPNVAVERAEMSYSRIVDGAVIQPPEEGGEAAGNQGYSVRVPLSSVSPQAGREIIFNESINESGRIMRNIIRSFMLLAVAAPLAAQGARQASSSSPAQVIPAAGEMAPDFAIQWADARGVKAAPLSLASLRGQVVVLAFYPADFSRGCTIEMTKFRDDYQSIFGDGVTVLPISRDSLSTHVRWADSMAFPFGLGSDTDGSVAAKYGSSGREPRPQYLARNVFVIGKDGKVAYSKASFNVNAQVGYDELAAAVAAAKK